MDYVYDLRTDSLHITAHQGTVHQTVEDGNLILDFDDRGWLISFTILSPGEEVLRGIRRAKEARGAYSIKAKVHFGPLTG